MKVRECYQKWLLSLEFEKGIFVRIIPFTYRLLHAAYVPIFFRTTLASYPGEPGYEANTLAVLSYSARAGREDDLVKAFWYRVS